MATREINAATKFVEAVMSIAGCTAPEAEKVLAIYRKAKMVKLQRAIGSYDVKHGAYLDVQVIRNAIALENW